MKISRALVSVTDKTGIVEFCQFLASLKIEILSTGGTAKVLREKGIPVKDVSDFTGSPEILDGRLKTLHPKIEGGILGIRSNAKHQKEMGENEILPIDLVVVNLYAFEKTIASGASLEEAVENIDIGGPTMLRAAAKNYHDVTVVVDPADYPAIMEEIKADGEISPETNFKLAVKVFETTARYDAVISNYLGHGAGKSLTIPLEKISDLRYGENPHQKAAFYKTLPPVPGSLACARQLHGKELSFNNLLDLEAALDAVRNFNEAACVIIKHTNPCGAALGENARDAFLRAKDCDPVSAFGGIIGFNKEIDEAAAKVIGETFFECIIAPAFSEAAFKILSAKKNIRLMVLDSFARADGEMDFKKVSGGFLVQDKDLGSVGLRQCKVVTKRKPTEPEYAELEFAWRMVKQVKSNAIVFTKNRQMIGVGAGQMSRVDSVKLAVTKANHPLAGSVLASDAFFPFRDGLDLAAAQKITAVIQPGGSVKDEEVIAAANEHGLAVIFTGMRHFKH
ncbi:MAG: bifunctional phosphoribosylaminoimidazolecarboxamide formyltransferase/IMP cyclohydrolase [Deltaproteobacteria bacterium]|nr:bifunctional phosphoribosylaminoimidazolecarboxamide formyltransferase/IMP cyclohydrolase [Deltaproteobacteria bacterium]